jgi:hypothetical protein
MKDQIKSHSTSGPERGVACKHNYSKMKSLRKIITANAIKRVGFNLFPAITSLMLTGCWTPPNANVQPGGEPRLIQDGISVESIRNRAMVQTIDASQRILNLKFSDGSLITCKVSQQVAGLDKIQAGDKIKVTLSEELAVYVLKDGNLPGADGTEKIIPFIASVQLVDPSYRLLKVHTSAVRRRFSKPT